MNKHIFLSVGEPSGDLLAKSLCQEISRKSPLTSFSGITGPHMESCGVKSIARIKDLSVMGFTSVLKKISIIKKVMDLILTRIDRDCPDLIILFDYPGFNLRLGEQLKLRGYPVLLYIAPQLWAWGKNRAYTLHQKVDHILGVLPFEEDFFKPFEVSYSYIGSPILDRVLDEKSKNHKRRENLIGFFPGSRKDELTNIFPCMLKVIESLKKTGGNLGFVIQIAKNFDDNLIKKTLNKSFFDGNKAVEELRNNNSYSEKEIVFTRDESLTLMQEVSFALVTSGTASLECALSETPMAVIYKISKINYLLAKRVIKIEYIAQPNLIANKRIVPEFIQNFDYKKIAYFIVSSLEKRNQEVIINQLKEMKSLLKPNASSRAAQLVLDRL